MGRGEACRPPFVRQIAEDPAFIECVVVTKHGLDWEQAWQMDPLERSAYYYVVAQMEGGRVDWETGKVKEPSGG